MDLRLKLLLGGILALLVGLAFSIPLLISNVKPMTTIELTVDVKYAYFNDQPSGGNIPGLKNVVSHQQYQMISYIIVLNVTNHSDAHATIEELQAAAAPQITTMENNGLEIRNPVVSDDIAINYASGWDQYLYSNQSRLLALTGTVSCPITFLPSLWSGDLSLYGKVEVSAWGSRAYSSAFSLKQVHLQVFGSEFLYNDLIYGNQSLQITNGFDAWIQSGS